MLLNETFNSLQEAHGLDYFLGRIDEEIVQNLNSRFELRDYQKEALGRFNFYFSEHKNRQFPSQLLFHMATGCGKTLIMAANILYLYKLGYRYFIFFVNSKNIIEKTKDNFLNPLSDKYFFSDKIKFGEKEVFLREVQNFETAHVDDINIIFSTIQGLHIRLNYPRENALTYEEFENKEVVFISDEAHHLQTLTKTKLTKNEEEEKKSWERTVERIFRKNDKNILLEFTATIDVNNENIKKKYEDKIIYQYDLKQFRLDKFSKEIEVLAADLEPLDRAIQATILSQYRMKVAGKYRIRLKPVLLLKSKSIKESKENYEMFLNKIKHLTPSEIREVKTRCKNTILDNVFEYFEKEKINFDVLIKELQEDFSEEKCMLLDSENVDEEKQLKLNSLEGSANEIRAIFAVNMLNEGWDVLNLFDIVRLFDTRDGKWIRGKYKPGNTTIGEAQLIGRGARYFPFKLDDMQDEYIRKFDEDVSHDLRVVETLHYHSLNNPKYIDEIKATLTDMGIIPAKYVQRELFIKDDFKKTDFWKKGYVFINQRIKNPRKHIKSFENVGIEKLHRFDLKTGEVKETLIFDENKSSLEDGEITKTKKVCKLIDFGGNIVRGALDKFEFYKFNNLKSYFPYIKSMKEFIFSSEYLGGVDIELVGTKESIENLSVQKKYNIALYIARRISEQTRSNTSEFVGSELFEANMIKVVFGKNNARKILKLDSDSERAKELREVDLSNKNWYAQNALFGTSEEDSFIKFIDEMIDKLKQDYEEIAILRNERFFKIFDFNEGRAFEPDFLMFLLEKNKDINIYQVFIEPKGDRSKDNTGKFEKSQEAWKQEFLLEMEEKADIDIKLENKHFKIIGLPFYNEKLRLEFQKAIEQKFLALQSPEK